MHRGSISSTYFIACAMSLALAACSGGGMQSVSLPAVPSAANHATTVVPSAAPASPTATASALSSPTAAPADSFVDSIGANSHFTYSGSSYATNFSAISAALVASGIRHIRDGAPGEPGAQALAYLGQAGIKHSIGFPVTTTAAQISATISENLPYVDFVEPANEFDENAASDPNWASEIASEQQLLYGTVHSNPAYAAIKVLGPSLADAAHAAAVGPLDAYEDAGNLHDYPCSYNPGTSNAYGIAANTTFLRASTQWKPIWTTEVGYADNMAQWPCALSDTEIAKFDPRTVAERWMYGETHTYFYQFADMDPNQNYNSMGLVSTDGAPKPQYVALQSMISLLADPGPQFQPTSLAYSLSGGTSNVQQLLLQKRDGSYYLLLWSELPGWDATSGLPIAVAPQNVSITFAKAPSLAVEYVYTVNWALVGTPLPSSTTMSIPVTDAITFVHLKV
jgi:hypothetical protein